ncbi:50S ribosomal protein L21 [Streptomyces capparidis]
MRAPGEAARVRDPGRLASGAPTRAAKRVGFAVYAIVRSGGRQHKVAVGDVIEVDRIQAEPGDTVELSTLLVVDGDQVTSDPWVLAGVKVHAEVVDQTKGAKIDILKYKNKTGYRKRLGHRQQYTAIKVTGIDSAAK